jgi:hypothetical protein
MERLVYFMAIWNILWILGTFYSQLVYFLVIWYLYVGTCFPFWCVVPRKIWQPWLLLLTRKTEHLLKKASPAHCTGGASFVLTIFLLHFLKIKSQHFIKSIRLFLVKKWKNAFKKWWRTVWKRHKLETVHSKTI